MKFLKKEFDVFCKPKLRNARLTRAEDLTLEARKEYGLGGSGLVISETTETPDKLDCAVWGFEQAEKLMLAKIKKEKEACILKVSMRALREEKQWVNALKWLEGELQ